MNFLDAHKILYAYVDVAAGNRDSKTPIRRMSELKNSKETILKAYKIFLAHMFAFDTVTQKEYELINSLIVAMTLFVDDKIVDELEECQRILEDRSFWGKIKNKTAIPFAREKRDNLLKKIAPIISEMYCAEEIDIFLEKIVVEATKYREAVSAMPKGTRETLVMRLTAINEYCFRAYEIAGIQMEETDVEYFYPFPILREFLQTPQIAYLYEPYKQYILSNS